MSENVNEVKTGGQVPELGPFPGKLGIHTARAVERLKKGVPGDTVTPDQMTVIVGRNCRERLGYGSVSSKIRIVERDCGVIWRWDRGAKLWRCLNDSERNRVTTNLIVQGRRKASRAVRVARTIEVPKLNENERCDYNCNLAAAGMMILVAGGPFHKRLALEQSKLIDPDPAKLLELMRPKTT